MGLEVGTSTFPHPEAGIDIFDARNFWKEELVGNYSETLVSADLGQDAQKKKTYGDLIKVLTVADFQKRALQMVKPVEHGTIGSLSVYIVSASFYAM